MKIIFAPSKGMKFKNINFKEKKEIFFKEKTDILINKLKTFSKEEIEKLFKIKGNLLEETYKNIQDFENLNFSPALSLYDGVTFRQLNYKNYSENEIDFLNENLFIFSALYGLLSPNTKIKPYRLDMTVNFLDENLYKFWSDEVNNFLKKYENEIFINLSSKEFSKLLNNKIFNIIDIEFRQNIDGKLKNISTEAKKARGLFLDYLTLNHIKDIEKIKEFSKDGYKFSIENSNKNKFFFIKD